jgi:hypothetical protein
MTRWMRSRPGSCASGILRKKVNWVLDADIRDFFTSLDLGMLRQENWSKLSDPQPSTPIYDELYEEALDACRLAVYDGHPFVRLVHHVTGKRVRASHVVDVFRLLTQGYRVA